MCRAQQIADSGCDREQPGVLAYKARDLQAERQAVDREQGQRYGRNAEHRDGTLKTGLPVEPSPTGATPGAASVIAAS